MRAAIRNRCATHETGAPPIKFKIDYDEDHRWIGGDYFGASRTGFHELFQNHDDFLACRDITGTNAFFVQNEFKSAFANIPAEIEKLYASPKYFLTGLNVSGHPPSLRTVRQMFRDFNFDRCAAAA